MPYTTPPSSQPAEEPRPSTWSSSARRPAIFDRAGSIDNRAGRVREPNHSIDCLFAAIDVPLCERSNARIRKHQQTLETIALLQRNENRLHRSGWEMFDRERNKRRQKRHCRRAWRQPLRCLERCGCVASLGSFQSIGWMSERYARVRSTSSANLPKRIRLDYYGVRDAAQ